MAGDNTSQIPEAQSGCGVVLGWQVDTFAGRGARRACGLGDGTGSGAEVASTSSPPNPPFEGEGFSGAASSGRQRPWRFSMERSATRVRPNPRTFRPAHRSSEPTFSAPDSPPLQAEGWVGMVWPRSPRRSPDVRIFRRRTRSPSACRCGRPSYRCAVAGRGRCNLRPASDEHGGGGRCRPRCDRRGGGALTAACRHACWRCDTSATRGGDVTGAPSHLIHAAFALPSRQRFIPLRIIGITGPAAVPALHGGISVVLFLPTEPRSVK